ncbi:MAG: hypothetical protein DRI24_17055 [Deltaproteobacteria bacterium]|nr:MAG: hypothetical protein DRI24_17055 [Deltaproteobacteria bacterium]
MNVKAIMLKLSEKSAANVVAMITWLLSQSESYWAAQATRHQEAYERNRGTSVGEKAHAAYTNAFDNWHTIRQVRTNVSRPIRSLGGRENRVSQ